MSVIINFYGDDCTPLEIAERLEELLAKTDKLDKAVADLQAAATKGFAEVQRDIQYLKDRIEDPALQGKLDSMADNVSNVAAALNALNPVTENDPVTPPTA